ncbi:MAG: hypothetical protein IPL33_10140 [Sphingobacteriales bacterium]|nr:hypothetical protein [Sphingobacteriales bacterium]
MTAWCGTYTVSVPATVDGNNPTTPITLTTTLSSGEHDPTLDFGYEPPTPLSSLAISYGWIAMPTAYKTRAK